MRYRFLGDTLQLVKYEVIVTDPWSETQSEYTAASGEEKDELLERYPGAEVRAVDNTGYEWLEGEIFTNEEVRAGAVEKAIEMGKEAYTEMKNAPTQEEINAMLMLEIARIKAGVLK